MFFFFLFFFFFFFFFIYTVLLYFFFFFQAEDGIRDVAVTGVQTLLFRSSRRRSPLAATITGSTTRFGSSRRPARRSEERRVGKEWRCPWTPYHEKKNI